MAAWENRSRVEASLGRRRNRERMFRLAGLAATSLGSLFLVVILVTLVNTGWSAFQQTYLQIEVSYSAADIAPNGEIDLDFADFDGLLRAGLRDALGVVSGREARREAYRLISAGAAYEMRDRLLEKPGLLGSSESIWVPTSAAVDMLIKGKIDPGSDAAERPLSDQQIAWIRQLEESRRIETRFNRAFFQNGDSREPELAGIKGAIMGSFLMLAVTFALALPIGFAAAVYLEEFAPRKRWSDLIEVNINNLAAVPSIVYGLLGLAFFVNFLGLPRSAPLVGGLVLSLVTMPVIIIASRAAIKAVPPSVREAAMGMGASRMQTVVHHVLPLAMPGMLTGTILGMSRALGESAPLLMVGMVAFIVDVPAGISDPATALPVQIYLWADSPERAFAERTSAAILVLLGFLMLMNLAAVVLRRQLERRW